VTTGLVEEEAPPPVKNSSATKDASPPEALLNAGPAKLMATISVELELGDVLIDASDEVGDGPA
jgi:hypothetical protein